jgi:hypothetical protein
MFDKLLTEKRPRWDDKSNKILGVCQEHGHDTSLEFTSEEDLQALWEELAAMAYGKIHLAHEVSVDGLPRDFLITSISRDNLMSILFSLDRQLSVRLQF